MSGWLVGMIVMILFLCYVCMVVFGGSVLLGGFLISVMLSDGSVVIMLVVLLFIVWIDMCGVCGWNVVIRYGSR